MLASLAPAGHASIGANVSAPPAAGAWGMRAFLLATSAGQRARLMLPTGVLSVVELPVTSKYVVALSSGSSRERGSMVSLATVWKGRLDLVPLHAGVFDPEIGVPALAPISHPVDVQKLDSKVERAHPAILL